MKKLIIPLLLLFFFVSNVLAYDKIYEFDENEDIIISTNVYNTTGQPCLDCSCNLSIFNTYPNESIIKFNNLMDNKDRGIYSYNVNNDIDLNSSEYIYPLTIVCNDTNGFYGGDTREGIKVSETAFNYTPIMLGIISIGFALLLASFKIDEELTDIKKLAFFSSFAFFFSGLAVTFVVSRFSPDATTLTAYIVTIITVFIVIMLAIVYLYAKTKITKQVEYFGKMQY